MVGSDGMLNEKVVKSRHVCVSANKEKREGKTGLYMSSTGSALSAAQAPLILWALSSGRAGHILISRLCESGPLMPLSSQALRLCTGRSG